MNYQEFLERKEFSKEELISFSHGQLVENPPIELLRLPAPPMLMIDRVLQIEKQGVRGKIVAQKDVQWDEWFFDCHFKGDPVQPGCLGVDAIWQLLGLFCACSGAQGMGRALGCKEVQFDGQIRPFNKVVRYEIDVRRYVVVKEGEASLVVGNGNVWVDGELIYAIKDAKVGTFKDIAYSDYPNRSKHSVGGIMVKGL